MDERKPISDRGTILKRFRLPIVLAVGLLLIAFLFRDVNQSTDTDTAATLSAQIPKVTEADISPEELRDIIDGLVQTHRWFKSLPFGRLEYQVSVTKSDARYERDIAKEQASFPNLQVDETTSPTLAREWKIHESFTFDESRLVCTIVTNALERKIELWNGNVLTGYIDHGTTQEPSYYLKSDVNGGMSKLAWFPHVGTPAIWFCDGTQDSTLDWQENPPTLAGATRFAEHECVVLRDERHHWIVGREDRKLYGRYSGQDLEQFSQHHEVSDGVFWPMASIRKRYGNQGLKWTDRTTVTSLEIDRRPDDSVFQLKMEAGVKVHDLRYEYPVVFTSDPTRKEEELAKIYTEAKEKHERLASSTRPSRELIGKDAPELGQGKRLNSKPLSLNELRGKRTVLLGFGHTACAPCANMLSLFSKLQGTSNDQLILVFAASDSVSDVEKKLSLYNLDCPTFITDEEPGFGEVFERYHVTAYPTLVTIDASGAITSHQVGTLSNE
jgi:thiol-disulfide isomerase/thioredoxin